MLGIKLWSSLRPRPSGKDEFRDGKAFDELSEGRVRARGGRGDVCKVNIRVTWNFTGY